jgi:hypothetical protein
MSDEFDDQGQEENLLDYEDLEEEQNYDTGEYEQEGELYAGEEYEGADAEGGDLLEQDEELQGDDGADELLGGLEGTYAFSLAAGGGADLSGLYADQLAVLCCCCCSLLQMRMIRCSMSSSDTMRSSKHTKAKQVSRRMRCSETRLARKSSI